MHGLLKKCSGVFSAATSEIDKNTDLVNPTDLTNFLNRYVRILITVSWIFILSKWFLSIVWYFFHWPR
jgi:hypothetical protein